jgi:hypothetical protein
VKSPRDASMIFGAVATTLTFVVVATLTCGVVFSSLALGTEQTVTVEGTAEGLSIPSEVGDPVEEAQLDVLATGQSAYELAEGDAVLVAAEEALPPVVVEEVKSELTAVAVTDDARAQAQALADQVSDDTGRSVILVFQEPDSTTGVVRWTHTQVRQIEPFVSTTQESVVASLRAWIAQQAKPERFEIILEG